MCTSSIWCLTTKTNLNKAQGIQIQNNKDPRIIKNEPWNIKNSVIHSDFRVEKAEDHITKLVRNLLIGILDHLNPIVRSQVLFAHNNSKLSFSYKTTKWSLPLKPP
ncbi:hypothetical protein AVEN_232046-1 [Araneus ventricosus]|uniref:Uncharacterized protein n=1 Tax=Araneus ventricosus TaxID=182803 RepID=A0A4Y2ELR3_ARAVE|nr:hypothetical protein AVEN_232046-1 [Araneus ventricosus]